MQSYSGVVFFLSLILSTIFQQSHFYKSENAFIISMYTEKKIATYFIVISITIFLYRSSQLN